LCETEAIKEERAFRRKIGREAAEEFIQSDPFVVNGVVSKWRLVEWDEVLA
jgi:uncharacterized protein YciI